VRLQLSLDRSTQFLEDGRGCRGSRGVRHGRLLLTRLRRLVVTSSGFERVPRDIGSGSRAATSDNFRPLLRLRREPQPLLLCLRFVRCGDGANCNKQSRPRQRNARAPSGCGEVPPGQQQEVARREGRRQRIWPGWLHGRLRHWRVVVVCRRFGRVSCSSRSCARVGCLLLLLLMMMTSLLREIAQLNAGARSEQSMAWQGQQVNRCYSRLRGA
jgi:hypothetical protein